MHCILHLIGEVACQEVFLLPAILHTDTAVVNIAIHFKLAAS